MLFKVICLYLINQCKIQIIQIDAANGAVYTVDFTVDYSL